MLEKIEAWSQNKISINSFRFFQLVDN